MANGTPASEGREPRTNVINGCTDATDAPCLRSALNSSLASAPLECRATLPFHRILFAHVDAVRPISASGTQNQTRSVAGIVDASVTTRAPTSFARFRAFASDVPREWVTTASILYPARISETASALPRFPAPTIVIRLPAMPGRIAEGTEPRSGAGRRKPEAFIL